MERGFLMDTQKETRDRRTLLIEIGNAVTHGIGAGLSIAGLILLIIRAVHTGSPMRIVTFTIYGSALILLPFVNLIPCLDLYTSQTGFSNSRPFNDLCAYCRNLYPLLLS